MRLWIYTRNDLPRLLISNQEKNYKMFYIMLMTEVAVSTLIMCFIPFIIGIIICIAMLFVINLLFAANYNMIVIEELLKDGYVPLDYNSSDILIKKEYTLNSSSRCIPFIFQK